MKKKPKVLIVDDDNELASELENILETCDYDVMVYNSPYFVNKLLKQRPDVVLVDVWFNGVADGLNEVRAINLQNQQVPVPVILMSSDPKVADYAKAVQATTYLTKPFDPDALIAKLESVLAHSTP